MKKYDYIKSSYDNVITTGEITLHDTAFRNSFPIKKIRAVPICDQRTDPEDIEHWNEFVDTVRQTAKVDTYFVFVFDCNREYCGVLIFYDNNGREIKMKHFDRWKELNDIVVKSLPIF